MIRAAHGQALVIDDQDDAPLIEGFRLIKARDPTRDARTGVIHSVAPMYSNHRGERRGTDPHIAEGKTVLYTSRTVIKNDKPYNLNAFTHDGTRYVTVPIQDILAIKE